MPINGIKIEANFCNVLFFILIFVGFIGVFSTEKYNLLPSTPIFEVLIATFSLLLIKTTEKKAIYFILTSLLYISASYLFMLAFNPANIYDFSIAYKSFYYIFILSSFVGKEKFEDRDILKLYNYLSFIFLFKYLLFRTFNLSELWSKRPGVFTENNFELVFLILLFFLASQSFRNNYLRLAIISSIVFLSGSRSAMLELLVVYIFVYLKEINYKTLFSFLIFLILTFLSYHFFSERLSGGSIENIDRYQFMMIFLKEISDWSFLNYMFGTPPITQLSPGSCNLLSFYGALLSSSNDGGCYSVILHSFLLRVIFDHGFIGLLFIIYFVFYALKRAEYSYKQITCIISVILVSGLSVSSFNSIYTTMILAIAFMYPQNKDYRKKPRYAKPHSH